MRLCFWQGHQEQRVQFYRSAKGKGQAESASQYETLVHEEEHFEYYNNEGEFLPISVWIQRGFDGALIQENAPARDRRNHPILGESFRVVIQSTGERGQQGARRTDAAQAKSKAPAAVTEAPLLALEDGEPQPSSSEDTSDAESSSTSDRRRKKDKKDKKGKKKSHKKEKKSKKSEKRQSERRRKECRDGAGLQQPRAVHLPPPPHHPQPHHTRPISAHRLRCRTHARPRVPLPTDPGRQGDCQVPLLRGLQFPASRN